MARQRLQCQVCSTKFPIVFELKRHIRSPEHQQRMKEVFPKDGFRMIGSLPHIAFLDQQLSKHAIIGLSLVTLCFPQEERSCFYLCHVCEEKCSPDRILHHITSVDHYSNYFSIKDPNVLCFSWMPRMMRETPWSKLSEESNEGLHDEQLQMLQLPKNLLEKLMPSTYSEVMHTLSENDRLLKILEAVGSKRMTIHSYKKSSLRTHSLLGMQHLVECVCVGPAKKKHYLCTLCSLTVASHMIIKHVLSFDHIFCYFKAWHPSTLSSKECYLSYTAKFKSMMVDLAKQTEKIHGIANTDMKQVTLEPAEFNSVNFTCYAEALKKLEFIKKSSLTTSIKPGIKLVHHANTAPEPHGINTPKPRANTAPAPGASKAPAPAPPANTAPAPGASKAPAPGASKAPAPPANTAPAPRGDTAPSASKHPAYKLFCQDCSVIFNKIHHYIVHLSKREHKMKLQKYFREAAAVHDDHKTMLFHLGLYAYVDASLKANEPAVGASLVVTCVTTHVLALPIYVCFACLDCFPQSFLEQHFNSRKHLIHTLLYLNPWRLPVAWEDDLDDTRLRDLAVEEEKERGPNEMILKVLDIPASIFLSLTPCYAEVMARLQLHHTLLKREVPQCQTYRRLQDGRFPVLGIQFLVKYDVFVSGHVEVSFLCLLCERRLSQDEPYVHVFSREHLEHFLNYFHPGSLNSSTNNAEAIVDLAKQAARIHPISHIQEIKLDKPIWEPANYQISTFILESSKRKYGKGELKPLITAKAPLIPRGTLDRVSNANELCVENGQSKEKAGDEETPQPSERAEIKREVSPKAISEEVTSAGETCQVKTERTEESPMREPSGEIPESCQNTDTHDRAETETGVRAQVKNYVYKGRKRKRPSCMFEKSKDTCSNEEVGREMGRKRQRLKSRGGAPCEESPDRPHGGPKEEKAADMQESHEAAVDKGLGALFECHCDKHDPIYLCERCCRKIPQRDVIYHVSGRNHRKMHLVVLDLKEELYANISKQCYESAIRTVKALQNLGSTSAWVKPVDTSVALHAQHDVSCKMDNMEVVNMDMDDYSEDPKAAPDMSAVTEIASKTTKDPPESSKDGTMSGIKVPEPADNSHSGTNATYLPPDSTGSRVKADVIPNTPMKSTGDASRVIATLCNAAATSQTGSTAMREATDRTLSTKRSPPKVGSSQLIVVTCGTKKQIYCRLCSVRLNGSSHLLEFNHQYKYVKLKYPGWSAPESELESKLSKIVTFLAGIEKAIGSSGQIIEVKESVYTELGALPQDKALERAKEIVSTAKAAEARRQEVALSSSCEVSSSNDVTVQQGHFDPDVEAQAHVEASPVVQSPGVTVEKPHGCAEPAVTESSDTFTQTLDTCQDSPVPRQQQRESDPAVQDTQKVLDAAQKTSHLKYFGPDPLAVAPTMNADQQNHPRPSHKAERVPKRGPGPRKHGASQALPTISIGEKTQGSSHLSSYLKVKELDTEPIIGRASVWECRGISPVSRRAVDPFYLCESCERTLSFGDICQHMVSPDHQLQFMWREHPQLLGFWSEQDLVEWMKLHILKRVAQMLSQREQKNDAQGILLRHDLFEHVRAAPFSEALKVVKSIKSKEKLSVFCLPTSRTPQQKSKQPEGRQSREESLPAEVQSARALETDQKSDNEAGPKVEKPHLEETAVFGDLDPDVSCSSSEVDSAVSSFPSAGTCPGLSMQPEFTPPVSQLRWRASKLQVKQAEVHPESPPLPTGNLEGCQSQSVSPKDKCLPTRKRPAETSTEMWVRHCYSNPLEDILPAKHTPSPLQPIREAGSDLTSESTFVNPAASRTLMPLKPEGTGAGSDKQNADDVNLELLADLLSTVKAQRSKMNNFKSDPGNAATISSCATSSCESEGQAAGAIVPTVTNADLENVNQFRPSCAATSRNAGQMQHITQTDRTRAMLPIDTIITARPNLTKRTFMGSYKQQDPAAGNRGHQVSFSAVPTASLSNARAVSGGYSSNSQTANGTNGHKSYLSCEAVPGYTTPHTLSVSTGGVRGLYASRIYPEQAVNPFSVQSSEHSVATPMSQRDVSLEMLQQYCSSWTTQWESGK